MIVIRIGDLVRWRGEWGARPAANARVTGIELCTAPRMKYGDRVNFVSLDEKARAVFTLQTLEGAKWAYGDQVEHIDWSPAAVVSRLLDGPAFTADEPAPAGAPRKRRSKAKDEPRAVYKATTDEDGDAIIRQACAILTSRLRQPGEAMNAPATVRTFLQLKLAGKAHEVFGVLFLDAQNRLIHWSEMFRGTLRQTSVYPREVIREALAHNAAGVILAHNHPSGVAEPSRADEALTRALQSAMALIDVRVLDHIIAAGDSSVSFAERGLL